MMRRFSRRRRGGGRSGGGASPIDAEPVLRQLEAADGVPAPSLEVYDADEVPPELAVVGSGESASGGRVFVTYSPNAAHALMAALAVGGRLAEAESFEGELLACSPEWRPRARSLLGIVGRLPYQLHALTVSASEGSGARVAPEHPGAGAVLSPAQIAGHLAAPAERDLFLRASRGLEGLAAKHGGALRGRGRALEFVLLARRVAELRAEGSGVSLTVHEPQRQATRLTTDNLSSTLDGLEGQLRKRLNDRRIREGEDGLRARAIGEFRTWHSLRALVPWPLGGSDSEQVDWVGVDVEGRPVIGAAREELSLASVAAFLEASLELQAGLPAVLANAAAPVVFDSSRLVLGGRSIGLGVSRVLDAITLAHELFEIRGQGDLELRAVGSGEAAEVETRAPRSRPRRRREPEATEDGASEEGASEEGDEAQESGGEGRSSRSRGRRGRGRGRRGGRGRGDAASEDSGGDDEARDDDAAAAADSGNGDDKPAPRFEEVSLFDLDDEPGDSGGGNRRRRRRGRRRSRGGSSDEGNGSSREDAPSPSADAPDAGGSEPDADDADDDALIAEEVEDLELEEVPDFEAPAPAYEDDEEEEAGEGPVRPPRRAGPAEPVVEMPELPRKRSAIVAHADRDSIVAAVLIARDVRSIDGLWVYPQDELMSFFRGVATDLSDDTPIYVVGFRPKPAIDVLQTASLYRERLKWFDHQEWPPEDLQALRDTLKEGAVHVTPGAGSSLPAVLECCSRRSRFTDKLVDLVAARFSEHDYERWGRLWWWRLGEMVGKTGDRRGDVDGLLSGRPSDLAKEAADVPTPPAPAEVEYVSKRDFRLVRFAGYGLVVVEVPEQLDLHLTARVARERYGAPLALAFRPDSEFLVFSGDELAGRRSLDLGALVEHVANKLEWVEQLSDVDHVARMRVRQLPSHPERLDEIVAEIAMGRSILER